ncbi:hypothetical protein [Arthrobacter sp. MAHUQ-56]|uniref:hypothetical protein n=1 Tax=Arthrobacter sp. MAHUQ-56 TaxID=2867411 RepID=UPI001C8572DB|nr:hypothetical protein [Arthrobacter sp. MAHUQ-56]
MTPLNHIEFHVAAPQAVEEELDSAVAVLQPAAVDERHGVLVTRHSPTHYSVAISAAVPFGTIMEQSY